MRGVIGRRVTHMMRLRLPPVDFADPRFRPKAGAFVELMEALVEPCRCGSRRTVDDGTGYTCADCGQWRSGLAFRVPATSFLIRQAHATSRKVEAHMAREVDAPFTPPDVARHARFPVDGYASWADARLAAVCR